MLGFVLADLRRQWMGVAAVALLVAFATALGVVVTLQERALRLGSARAAAAFDLVVGAPGSETQLVLSSVFLQPAPLQLLPGKVLADLSADPRVAWAAPVGFGDFVGDAPVVGTTTALVAGIGGVAEGRGFTHLGDAVVGASSGYAVGAELHPIHGTAHERGEAHGAVTYTVVGRLAPTGTPWDRAVLVPIEAVWRIHGAGAHHDHADDDADHHDAAEASEPPAGAAADGHARNAHGAEDHAHGAPFDADAPVSEARIADPDAPGVPALVVKPRTFADAYKLRQAYRSDRTLAVFPAEVLTRLYGTLGDARLVLGAVALGAQGLVAAALLLVIVAQVLQRRRQIGALRAFGAPRAVVFAIVWLETVLVAGAGLVAGYGIGFAIARAISDRLAATSGVVLPVAFVADDVAQMLALLAAAAVAAAVPAALAYRQSPAEALRG